MDRSRERGGTAVEVAIILPVLVLIIFGIIEFGLLLYDQQVVTNASREGARAGIVQADPRPGLAAINSVVNSYTTGYLISLGTASPAVSLPTGPCTVSGNNLIVSVTYPYAFLVLGNLGFRGPTLNARTTMVCE